MKPSEILGALVGIAVAATTAVHAANPIITNVFTADPAPFVYKNTVYLYVGQDEAKSDKDGYRMNRWLVFSSTNMVDWQSYPSPLAPSDFSWAKGDAWAGHMIERGGKFFWYLPMNHATIHGKAIGVAVGDSPVGPFKDARGSALISNDMTKATDISWDDIDPAAFIDDDGQAWLFWGNRKCYYAKLKPNMIELDGPINVINDAELGAFEEAPWVHKRNGIYYLSYATGFPERTAYATAEKITGPWKHRGLLAEGAFNSNTIHQGIIDFKGRSYFFYHNGGMQRPEVGGSYRRSVCIDYLHYKADGTIERVFQTTEGVSRAAE
jgi:beta-xylosidase